MYVVSHLLVAVVPVVGALFGTAILTPPARLLRDRGLPPLLATWIVFLIAISIGAGLAWWLVPSVGSEIGTLRGSLAHGLDQVRTWLTGAPLHLSTAQVDAFVGRIRAQASASSGVLLHGALAGALLALEFAASVLLTIVLTFFFVKDGGSLAAWLGGFAEPSRRDRMQGAATLAWQTFSAYVQGTAINGLVNGTLMGLGLAAIGVPLAVPIAVITFFGGFFPLVGGLVSGGVAVLVALATKGVSGALLVAALTVLIHHVEGYVVGPFVLGRKVNLHAVVIVLALSVGTVVGGVFGAFVAVPVVAISLALVEFYRGLPVEVVATTDQARSLPRARLAVVRWASNRRERDPAGDGVVPPSATEALEPGPQPKDDTER
jgi:predicted PurR-regulated permease PerM